VEAVSYDPALAGHLLRSANSAASAARIPVLTVRDAVVRLGRASVLSLAFSTNVRSRLNDAMPEYGLGPGDLWRNSVLATLAAELVMTFATVPIPPEAAAAALLADIGKLALHHALDAETQDWLLQAQTAGGLTRREAETELLTVHHGELGGLIAQDWKLPPSIVNGIIYHHTPNDSPDQIAHTTYLACMISAALTLDPEADHRGCLRGSMKSVGLDESHFDELCELTSERFEVVKAHYL
jgi:HD-like signal output (HDOD) protein